jgi:cell wall-associated NlpC family hydrolase
VAVVAISGGSAAADPSQNGAAAVLVIVAPDGTSTSTGWISGTNGGADVDPQTLPALAAGSGDSSASVSSDSSCVRGASTVDALTVRDGAVTATQVDSAMSACLDDGKVQYSPHGSGVAGVQVLGAPVDPDTAPIDVGDWGVLTFGDRFVDSDGRHARATMHLHLTADHGDVLAGTDIYVGYAAALQTPPKTDPGNGGGGGTDGSGEGSGGGGGGQTDPGGGSGGSQGGGGDGGFQHSGGTQHHHQGDGGKHQHHQQQGHHHHHHQQQGNGPVVITHNPLFPSTSNTTRARASVILAAAAQLGWPYIWGGESRAEGGFDCSGLVDYAYDAAGFTLPGRPTAAVLWYLAKPIKRSRLRPGDLVFLGAPTGDPYHVGMFVGHGKVVVAPHRGAMVELVPLSETPWDGFGTLWNDGPHGSKLAFGLKQARHAMLEVRRMNQRELARELAADRIARQRALQISLLRASSMVASLMAPAPPVTPAIDLITVARMGDVPLEPPLPVLRPNTHIPWIDRRAQHPPALGAWPSNPVTTLWTFDLSMPM